MLWQTPSISAQLRYAGIACLITLVLSIGEPLAHAARLNVLLLGTIMLVESITNIVFLYGFILLGIKYEKQFLVLAYIAGIVITIIGTITSLSHVTTVFQASADIHIVAILAGLINVWAGLALLSLRKAFGSLLLMVAIMNIVWGIGLTLLAVHNQMSITQSAFSIILALIVGLLTWVLNIAEAILFFRAARQI
jgi:hypothetical protein